MAAIARSGPLTLAQRRMWLRSYWRGHGEFFPAWTRRWELPPGISADAVAAAFAVLAARHEILRTVFLIGPDGEPVQAVLAAEGFRPPVSVVESGPAAPDAPAEGAGPLTVGAAFARPLWSARLHAAAGRVHTVDLVFDHIVSDGAGLQNWREQLLDLCEGRDAPRPTAHPLDRQAAEPRPRTVPGRWEPEPDAPADLAAHAPQIPVPGHGRPVTGPRYVLSSTSYQGLLPLVDRVCERTAASRATVFMTAVAWLLNRYAGHPRTLFANYVSHRVGRDDGIECRVRPVDVLVETDGAASFAEALRAVSAATMRAYERDLRFGPVAPEQRARTAAERGAGFVVPVYFNFQGRPRGAGPSEAPDPKVLVDRRAEELDELGRPWCVVVYVYVQGAEVVLDVDVDLRMLSLDTVHAFADVLPELIRLMAERPDALVGAGDALLPPDFAVRTDSRLLGDNWVDLPATARVLRSAAGVREAEVAWLDGELTARLELEPDTVLFDVHEHLLAAQRLHLDVVAPRRYLPPVPAGSGAPGWWPADLPRDGWRPERDAPRLPPETEAERELCAAIRETHGIEVDDLALSYVAAGGLVLRAPAVVEALLRRRLTGLNSSHFGTPYTLRAIARCLRPEAARATDGATYLG
ncbi:condensation domain-containing protein [Kitasatospora sp. NPDC049285]|uniref:condensation domain-containing protein n=1 Tax=Kitasatospora sp. NPDC049285 TaxID=3157096 RepID=UPI00342568CF